MTTAELEKRLTAVEQEPADLKKHVEQTRAMAATTRGLDEANRGLGIPLRQVDDQLRAKHGIPRQ